MDLIVIDNLLITQTRGWEISDTESCSDHRYITFEIGPGAQQSEVYNFQGLRFLTNEDGFKKLEENLIIHMGHQFFKRLPITNAGVIDQELRNQASEEPEIENTVDKFQEALEIACKMSFKTLNARNKKNRKKSIPWWTP